jgi:hypothetical protein
MKKHLLVPCGAALCLLLSAAVLSCKKNATPPPPRTIRYILYTKQDFSTGTDTIRFRLHMHTTGATGRILLDSNIAPMMISEIPDQQHQLVFEKTVPAGHDQDKLVVGFVYDIDNVGEGWYLDSSLAGQATKIVEYSFK